MRIIRGIAAYLVGAAIAYAAATIFYTQQILASQAAIGAVYTPAQQAATYLDNFKGLTIYGAMIAVALLVAFAVAAVLKRILTPLAPIAYPLAGAAGIAAMLFLIDNTVAAGGVGVIGGAREPLGFVLQCVAGGLGGLVFALISGGGRR